jgi:SAM-dependent methyltransferase
VLTVDYQRLRVRPGHRLLDLGCGGGRHSCEALRLGAWVAAVDSDLAEVREANGLMAAMETKGEAGNGARRGAVVADALNLPFRSGAFDRVIASEVLEHLPADRGALSEVARVTGPGGKLAVSVPRWWPERVNWGLSRSYHERDGGHVRIYRRSVLLRRLRAEGLRYRSRHHAHALHSPYWWLRCAVGVDREQHRVVRRYHALLVWDITHPSSPLRLVERLLNPVLGKSLVVYMDKPHGC